MLKITARSIVQELERRGVLTEVLDESIGLVRYQKDGVWRMFRSSTPDSSSQVGSMVADRKHITTHVLDRLDVRVPATLVDASASEAHEFLGRYGSVVVKPRDSAHGNGVSVDVTTKTQLDNAIKADKEFDSEHTCLLQEQVSGEDLRVLVIGGRVAAAAIRRPASVIGDGTSTIRQLIVRENEANQDRGQNYETRLNKIDIDAATRYLGTKLDEAVPAKDETVRVTGPANIGTGGESEDVTDRVLPSIATAAEKISQMLGLPTCGVDFMVDDLTDEESYVLIEVNTCPSFGLHLSPSIGRPQPVAERFVDYILEAA